jgi:hypothetical protein
VQSVLNAALVTQSRGVAMAQQDFPCRPPAEQMPIPGESTAGNKRFKNPPRGRNVRGQRPRRRKKSTNQLLESAISLIAVVMDPLEHLLAHTVALIPANYVKAVMFDCSLIVIVLLVGNRFHESHGQNLCFASIGALSLIAVLLTVAHVRNPSDDERLRRGQDERFRAIRVKPFEYQTSDRRTPDEDTGD